LKQEEDDPIKTPLNAWPLQFSATMKFEKDSMVLRSVLVVAGANSSTAHSFKAGAIIVNRLF
jgi:hypothetical protein